MAKLLDKTPWVLEAQAPEYAKVVAGLRKPAALRKFVLWKIDQTPRLKEALSSLPQGPELKTKIQDLIAGVNPEEVVEWLDKGDGV